MVNDVLRKMGYVTQQITEPENPHTLIKIPARNFYQDNSLLPCDAVGDIAAAAAKAGVNDYAIIVKDDEITFVTL